MICALLIGIGELEQQRFVELPPHELKADGQPFGRETGRNRDRRKSERRAQTAVVAGPGKSSIGAVSAFGWIFGGG